MDIRATIAQILRTEPRTLIVCHVAPDGDCLGAGLALGLALERLGKQAVVACQDKVPTNLRFLPGADRVVADLQAGPYPVAVTVECGTLERAGTLAPAVAMARTIVAIDHHEGHQPYAHLTDCDPRAAAVGESVANLITRLGVPVDRPLALNLLAAVVTDTGVFRFANTSAHTLRLSADLVDRGATIPEIVRAVYEERPPGAVRAAGTALQGLTLHEEGQVAITVVTADMIEAAGTTHDEIASLPATLRTIAGVRLAIALVQAPEAVYVSIRARDGVRADAVARALGGGGHVGAAGAEMRRPIDEVAALALEAARHELRGRHS